MILQFQRLLERMRLVLGGLLASRTFDLDVVLHQDPVVQHGDRARFRQLAILVEAGRVEDDIVGLPFAGFAGDVER